MLSFLVLILLTISFVLSHPIHALVDPTRDLTAGVPRGRDSAHPILLRDVDFSAPIQGRGTISVHKAGGSTGAWQGAAGSAIGKAQQEIDAAAAAQKKAQQSMASIKSNARKSYGQTDRASAKLLG
jgi:hypothetical protein